MDPLLGTVRTRTGLAAGLTRATLRGPDWERRGHGLHRPAGIGADPADEHVADAVAALTAGCVLGGWASLRLQGNTFFDGRLDGPEVSRAMVHCPPGTQLRHRPTVAPFRGEIRDHEIMDLDGYPVSTMARAAYDEMRTARGLRAAVVAADMATSTVHGLPHASARALGLVIDSHHKTRGLVQARRAATLSNSRSASPLETKVRLVAVLDAGLENWLVNVPIFDRYDRLLGIADLLDPGSGLVVEVDGGQHRDIAQHAADNVREEQFERTGLVVCRVTSIELADRFAVAARMVAAHRQAARTLRQHWTLDEPRWWPTWAPGRRYRR